MTDCQIICRPNVFDAGSTVYANARAGMTLAQMLGNAVSHASVVTIDGYPVPRELWARVKPKAGKNIHVMLFPQGGNAGKWVRAILMVVLAIYAPYLAPALGVTGVAADVITLGVMIVGSLAINALIPPPTPKGLGNNGGDPFQQLDSITGTSNNVNPYGVIPCVVGTYVFYPPHAALPYTSLIGDQQYLYMMLDLGPGNLTVSDIKIGQTAIGDFDQVEYEITKTPTLYTNDVYELSVGTTLDDGDSDQRTTQTNTEEISLDLIFGQGLFGINNKNKTKAATANFTIQYQEVGDSTWTNISSASGLQFTNGGMAMSGGTLQIVSSARKTLRCGVRWKVAKGQYNVKVIRSTTSYPDAIDQGKIGDCAWTVLRSVAHKNPSTTGTNKLVVRIKATDQLQGVVQNLSCKVAQNIATWDKDTKQYTSPAPTQNPAWIYLWLLTQCPAVARRLDDSRVDLDGIAEWAADCDDKGYKVSFVMDSPRAFSSILRDVLACGRASFGLRNGLYTAIRDIEQTTPVQMFTPVNSWGFSYSRAFADLPHALRCKFVNPEAGYKQDFVTVYAPGYNEDGTGGKTAATRFETLDLGPVVDPDAAWLLGNYHMAVILNRPNQYVVNADIENLVCTRGDMIAVSHDVIELGKAYGRVVSTNEDGDGDITQITLDTDFTMESGKSYAAQVRNDGTVKSVASLTNPSPGTASATFHFSSAQTDIEVGDLVVIGEANSVTTNMVVRQIEPDSNLNAKLTCVDAAQEVWDADKATPPTFVSSITGNIFCEAPPAPSVTIIESDQRISNPNDGGITAPKLGLGVDGGAGTGILRLGPNLVARGAITP